MKLWQIVELSEILENTKIIYCWIFYDSRASTAVQIHLCDRVQV